jgi:hypothetical protein
MRIPFRPTTVAFIGVVTILLTGCAPTPVVITPKPSPSSSPVFASDEDALAAATEAYKKYTQAVDLALSTHDIAALADAASDEAMAQVRDRVAEYEASGEHQQGMTTVGSTSLATTGTVLDPGDSMQMYACIDLSDVDIRDSEGVSEVQSDRPTLVPMIIELAWQESTNSLVVTSEELWGGHGVC